MNEGCNIPPEAKGFDALLGNAQSARQHHAQQADFMDLCEQPRYNLLDVFQTLFYDKTLKNLISLGGNLINEEANLELRASINDLLSDNGYFHSGKERDEAALNILTSIADGAIDTVYVVHWLLNLLGMPVDELFNEVHRSNMAKSVNGKALKRSDGKILKPEGWQAPNLKHVLAKRISALQLERVGRTCN